MEIIRKAFELMFMALLLSFVLISCVSAQENTTDLNATGLESYDVVCLDNQELQLGVEPDTPDLVINISNDNVYDYFERGYLKEKHSGSTFFITEDMEDLGIVNIKASNVIINGCNHTLKNTAFCIWANNVTLNNFTLVETASFEDNDYAAINVWQANNAKICNVNIDYNASRDSEAYAIYSEGTRNYQINNLAIVNCTINFRSDNRGNGRAFAVRMEYSPNALFSNNTINAELPLRTVAFQSTTAVLESEFALAVGIGNCNNMTFTNNTINTKVNVRPECAYPTLDSVFICDSHNCNFTNNKITLRDDITYKDEVNYLYALDIYRADNLLIEGNDIHVETKGGAFAAGTAYPIQLTGPASGVLIKYNEIYTKSNGPNIGIYSHNFNGDNYITILNNHINVTGRAGNHSWALVAGIESQDNNDIIMNNLIEVHNIQAVKKEDNIYGISYSQKTDSTHTYRVVNNTVISDGYYVSHMLDADNTTVTNNTLVRTDKYADTDYDPFKRGDSIGADTDAAKNNDFSGNRVITIFEYGLEHQSNEIDGGDEFNYVPPENVNGYTNVINGSGIAPQKPGFPGGNPLIPGGDGTGAFNTGGNNAGGFTTPDSADGDNGYNGLPDLSGDDGKSLSTKRNLGGEENVQNSFSNEGTTSNSYNSNMIVPNQNSTATDPSVDGVSSSGSSKSAGSSSAGAAGSSGASQDTSKAYEITKNIVEDSNSMIKFIGLAVVCEILLVIGYKRRENEEY